MLYRNELETTGNIGNIEIKTTNGNKVAFVSIAVNERRKDKDTGEFKQYTDWINWKFFGNRTVNFIENYAAKGDHVCVRGKVRSNNYTKHDGSKVYGTDCIGFRFDFVQPRSNQHEPGAYEPDENDLPY